MKNIYRTACWIACLLCCVHTLCGKNVEGDVNYVLIINTYTESTPWSNSMIYPIVSMASQDEKLGVYTEHMNMLMMDGEEELAAFEKNIFKDFETRPPKLIVLLGTASFILCEDLDRQWPDIPIILCGERDYAGNKDMVLKKQPLTPEERMPLTAWQGKYNMTSMPIQVYFEENLDLMKRLIPGMKEVLYIGDETYICQQNDYDLKHLMESGYPELKYRFLCSRDIGIDSLFTILNQIDVRTTGILFSSWFQKRVYAGNTVLYANSHADSSSKSYLKSESYKLASNEMYEELCVTASAYLRYVDEDWNYTQPRHLFNDYLNYLDYNRYKYKKTEDGIRLIDSRFDYYVGITQNGKTRYLSNIKDIENYDSETDKIEAFKSSHKNYILRRDNEIMSDRTSSGQIVDYYYNTAEYQDNVTEEFYADNLMPVGGSYYDNYGRYFYNYGNYDPIAFYNVDSRYNVMKGLDLKNGLKYSDRLEDEEIGDDYDTDDGNEYYDYDNGRYYYEDDYGNTWAKCENLYDLPDYKATDNDDSGITVFFAPKAEKLTAMEKEYTEALNDMYRAKLFVIVFGVIEFILVCYLLLICAYNAEPESVERWKQGNFLKKVPTEVYLILMALAITFAFVFGACWNYYVSITKNIFDNALANSVFRNILAVALFALAYFAGFGSLMEFVGKIKTRSIFKESLICRLCKFLWRKYKETSLYHYFHGLPLGVKLSIRTIAIGVILFLESAYYSSADVEPFLLVVALILMVLDIRDFSQLSKLSKQIDSLGEEKPYDGKIRKTSPVYAESEKLNSVQDKVRESVEQQIQSERLKIELVTNVSHDLKTPLTSIISYIDLLKKMDLNDEASSYVKILDKKAQKLKGIVSDVFSIAKATSGVDVNLTKLDFVMLLNQCIADAEDKIADSGKIVKININADSAMVMGDGDKLYRVFQNIVDNALNYSMDGTRIFLDVYKKADRIVFAEKNISATPINFTEEEILERFVRGDKSRTDGGSGLGLSISKSFTEACGGIFNIEIDGDMFKAIVEMPIIQEDTAEKTDDKTE